MTLGHCVESNSNKFLHGSIVWVLNVKLKCIANEKFQASEFLIRLLRVLERLIVLETTQFSGAKTF